LKSKLAICFTALVAGCLAWAVPGSGDARVHRADAQKAQKVRVHDNFFDRRSIRVVPGDRVVWVWKGKNRHNVRFTKVPRGAPRGGSKTKSDGRWRRTFKVEGTYRYICKLFIGMRGTVTVRNEPSETRRRAR
jgi:plastocyanin